jgi:hypothetical protein
MRPLNLFFILTYTDVESVINPRSLINIKYAETNIKLINQELDQMKEEMSRIKVTLYAKFGNNINLEYDEEN